MKEYAELFKVLSDENRLKIIELLVKGETCSCDLVGELPISQPTLSYHLKLLAEAKLITSEKVGNKINHKVNRDLLMKLSVFVSELTVCTDVTCNI